MSPRPAKPLVIAHRGASAYRPENTLAAYALAVEQRADMIEVDLHRTRCGAVAIRHDAELDEHGGPPDIGKATLAEVQAVDVGAGERVPSLTEMLDAYGDTIPFNLEIKWGAEGAYEGIEAVTLEEVQRRDLLARTLFSSFYPPVLQRLRALSTEARIASLVSRKFPERALDRAAAVGAEAINPELPLVDADLVGAAHDAGLAVYVFTVNETDDMKRLLDLGVDGMFTNHPDRLRALVD